MSEDVQIVEDYVQKIPASEMCWTHLKKIGECDCYYEEIEE